MSYSIIKNFPLDDVFHIIKTNKTIQMVIKKFIDSDDSMFKIAKQMKEDRQIFTQSHNQFTMNSLNPLNKKKLKNMIKKFNSRLNTIDRKLTLLNIVPIGLNNMCHFNSERLVEFLNKVYNTDKFKIVKGFNIFSCDCGKMVQSEIHSVVKYKEEYLDITEDFDGVKQKNFIECDKISGRYNGIKQNGYIRKIDFWIAPNPQHYCRRIYVDTAPGSSMDDFDDIYNKMDFENIECERWDNRQPHRKLNRINDDAIYISNYMNN